MYAAAAGTVLTAACTSAYCDRDGNLDLGGYGNLVELDHGDGVTTRYAHLSGYTVTPGEQVPAGALLGFQCSTGNSTGSTGAPSRRTSKCRWTPVLLPVDPWNPSSAPALTRWPAVTVKADRCA